MTIVDPQLLNEIYAELKRRAHAVRRGQLGETLDTTALVHEAWLKLRPRDGAYVDRRHLVRTTVLAMRQLLVDNARARQTQKRGGDATPVTMTANLAGTEAALVDEHGVIDAIERLRTLDARKADAIEMQAFGGATYAEIADFLGVSEQTVKRDLAAARTLLTAWLEDAVGTDGPPAR
ncbi:ECF-type sigma factor [Dokdonella sp.]|uniref:ECF-type sigma factor n=1 Tax=Dokdonella sp. TaxID=2291710 RepID=UPI0025BAF44C|nr:ECF-type sigma factor [Dokdonella sp.]MBX3693035.1 sigma-70 family RNA polymerase sigma factor [Dokdonella sp.]MCW5568892.1 sigma-70 family RNA polymerase sigma factor [Dokdonella sp.]